jgi:SAM-dependent methyltransferase
VHSRSDFERAVRNWRDIPGWFQWRDAQEEAVAHFGDGSRFVEVGCYLGKSLASLAEVVRGSGRDIAITGVDTGRGSGPEGVSAIDAHGPAVEYGGGTFVGILHRNLIACAAADLVQLLISESVSAARLFPDESLAWVHLDAGHEYADVAADIAAWAPKVRPGGWLSGDDYNPHGFPGVVAAVGDALPDAQVWWSTQWRWLKPEPTTPAR